MAPWKLPLAVVAIAVPIAFAFYAGGPGLGVAAGALVAVGIVVVAVRQRPRGAIGKSPAGASHRRLLLVVSRPVEDPAAIATIAEQAKGRRDRFAEDAEVLVVAPSRIGFLDRWASDLEGARHEAQQSLVITVASLAKVGVAAQAQVGDEDLVQAVEDATQSFAATEVILVTAADAEDPAAAPAAEELEARLRAPFRHLVLSGPGAR